VIVHVTTNAEPVGRAIRTLFRDQERFARAMALNATALAAQAAQRAQMESIFTVRNRQFVSRAVKFKPRATKRSPVAVLRLEPPGGMARADILGKFETETEKRPHRQGGGPSSGMAILAVPLPALRRTGSGRPAKADAIAGRQWIRVNDRTQVSDDLVRVMVTATTGVIYRRKARGGTIPLYVLVASVPLEPELRFVATIQATAAKVYADEYRQAWEHALRTAK
jgi:hypothetical protein